VKLLNLITWVLVGLIAVCVYVAAANAQNIPHEKINAIASKMAGKTVSIHCEINSETWHQMVQDTSGGTRNGTDIDGYAFPNGTRAFVSPRVCEALWIDIQEGYLVAGLYPLTNALFAVLHEAVHLTGVMDENITDCTALKAFKSFLPMVGVPLTVTKVVIDHGTYRYKKVPNPHAQKMVSLAQRIHDTRPAEYSAPC
jgi:hypothetical protein